MSATATEKAFDFRLEARHKDPNVLPHGHAHEGPNHPTPSTWPHRIGLGWPLLRWNRVPGTRVTLQHSRCDTGNQVLAGDGVSASATTRFFGSFIPRASRSDLTELLRPSP